MKTFKYVGKIYKNCDPSGAQQAALKGAQDFTSIMHDSYKTVFGMGSSMYNSLKAGWDKIINTEHGMSSEELAARRSQATNASAANIQKVNRHIGEHAAMTSAVPGVESGVTQAVRAGATAEILGKEADQQAEITAEDYNIGRKERDLGMTQEAKLGAETMSPAAEFGSLGNTAQSNEAAQANANEAASTSWMGLVGGLADSAIGAAGVACVSPDTMIMMADGSERIAGSLREGDEVLGFEGPEMVEEITTFRQNCVRVTTENGRSIDVSESHTFSCANRGYVRAINSLNRVVHGVVAEKVVEVKHLPAGWVIMIKLSGGLHGYLSNGIWSLE